MASPKQTTRPPEVNRRECNADLYGPDVPRMMGLRRQAAASSVTLYAKPGAPGSRLQAVSRPGGQLASAGFLIGENQALGVQAGLAQAIAGRLITQTAWAKETDCLVVDLPPGTADIQQFVFQMRAREVIVVLVVTPQVVAHVTKLASIPFSPRVAADADQGLPVMISHSSPEQVAAFESAAAQVQRHLDQ